MKRSWIETDSGVLSITKQADLIGLPRSTYYYQELPLSKSDILIMNKIDEIYTRWPFMGARRISRELKKVGLQVGRKHTGTLMARMGLQAVYPIRSLSRRNPEHTIYPYLLRNLKVERPNQVWSADITYIRLPQGFVYLVVVMDWYSRAVLSWKLSTTLDGSFCREALQEALLITNPEIFNTDQGVQFTDDDFISILKSCDVRISMDGRGRCLDNVFVERLWRTVKYEEVYLKSYENVMECRKSLEHYFRWYNEERGHQALGYRTPMEVYRETTVLEKAS